MFNKQLKTITYMVARSEKDLATFNSKIYVNVQDCVYQLNG